MYKVYVEIPFGPDDYLDSEYTGNRYATYDVAKPELLESREDPGVCFAWIEEVECLYPHSGYNIMWSTFKEENAYGY